MLKSKSFQKVETAGSSLRKRKFQKHKTSLASNCFLYSSISNKYVIYKIYNKYIIYKIYNNM